MTPVSLPLSALPFLVPGLAVAGGVAVGVPIAIHFLSRMRRQRVDWAATRFLYLAWKKQHRRQQIEQLILLLLRCAMMVLAGLALAGLLMPDKSAAAAGKGRQVCLVIDDGLTSGTVSGVGRTRLDDLKAKAKAALSTLAPTDRVALWSAATPAKELVPPSLDRAALQKAIDGMQPRFSRSDVPVALSSAVASGVKEGVRPVLLVLSDFSRGSLYLDDVPPADLENLGDRADLVLLEPALETANWQLASVHPRRGTEVPSAVAPTLATEVSIRRFAGTEAAKLRLRTTLTSPFAAPGSPPVAVDERDLSVPEGQTEVHVSLELPLPGGAQRPSGHLLLTAQLLPATEGTPLDALAVDDKAYAAVRLCPSLEVAMIDEPAAGMGAVDLLEGNLQALGLNTEFSVHRLLPGSFKSVDLEALTAVFVLRPDLVGAPGWQSLHAFAARGGVVWVIAPAVDSTAWTESFFGVFQLPWKANGPMEHHADGLAAAIGHVPPELAALNDWDALMRPLKAYQRINVTTPMEDVWLPFVPVGGKSSAWLAHHATGDGEVILLAAPLSIDEKNMGSNLAIRQAFVPLVHEGLRAGLGLHASAPSVSSGQKPRLTGMWTQQASLTGPDGETVAILKEDEKSNQSPVRPAMALETPGAWCAGAGAAGRFVPVSVDAPAGDTRRAAEVSLGGWYDRLGKWRPLPSDAQVFEAVTLRPNELTRPLLWALLCVLLLEAMLARIFSHATTGSLQSLVAGWLRQLKGEDKA